RLAEDLVVIGIERVRLVDIPDLAHRLGLCSLFTRDREADLVGRFVLVRFLLRAILGLLRKVAVHGVGVLGPVGMDFGGCAEPAVAGFGVNTYMLFGFGSVRHL